MDAPVLIPAKMLNALAFCPRLYHLEHVQREFAENVFVAEGVLAHRGVEGAAEALEGPALEEGERLRSVELSAPGEGLIARMDVVEGRGGALVPVETKRGRKPRQRAGGGGPEGGVWEPERVQLCAQGLILRELGYRVDHGFVFFAASRQRVKVPFDEALVARTRALVVQARALLHQEDAPPPLRHDPRCAGCSLAPICLPDAIHALRDAEAPQDPASDATEPSAPRRVQIEQERRHPLYVQHFAARVSKDGDLLKVTFKDEVLATARLREVSQLVLAGSSGPTPQALAALMEHQIPIVHLSYGGHFQGITHAMPHKGVDRRLRQFRAAEDPAKALDLARTLVTAKIRSSRVLLRRNHPAPPRDLLPALHRLARRALRAESIEALRGIEGAAARLHFSQLHALIRPPEGQTFAFHFEGRNRRPPTDPVNALLSFGYTLLCRDLTLTALAVGFDPYLGFYHQPRSGRPALALDLMEPFRHVLVDATVCAAINSGELHQEHFLTHTHATALTPEGRRAFIAALERRLQQEVTHPAFSYPMSWRRVFEAHTRLLDRYLAREIHHWPILVTR